MLEHLSDRRPKVLFSLLGGYGVRLRSTFRAGTVIAGLGGSNWGGVTGHGRYPRILWFWWPGLAVLHDSGTALLALCAWIAWLFSESKTRDTEISYAGNVFLGTFHGPSLPF